jgi:hypothetical protein
VTDGSEQDIERPWMAMIWALHNHSPFVFNDWEVEGGSNVSAGA